MGAFLLSKPLKMQSYTSLLGIKNNQWQLLIKIIKKMPGDSVGIPGIQ
jgi:hypothetical protein